MNETEKTAKEINQDVEKIVKILRKNNTVQIKDGRVRLVKFLGDGLLTNAYDPNTGEVQMEYGLEKVFEPNLISAIKLILVEDFNWKNGEYPLDIKKT